MILAANFTALTRSYYDQEVHDQAALDCLQFLPYRVRFSSLMAFEG
jgi:hypothetical protein